MLFRRLSLTGSRLTSSVTHDDLGGLCGGLATRQTTRLLMRPSPIRHQSVTQDSTVFLHMRTILLQKTDRYIALCLPSISSLLQFNFFFFHMLEKHDALLYKPR